MKNILRLFLITTISGLPLSGFAQEALEEEIQMEESALMEYDPAAVFQSLPQPQVNDNRVNLSFVPMVFSGYREIPSTPSYSNKSLYDGWTGGVIDGSAVAVEDNLEDEELTAEEPVVNEVISLDNTQPTLMQYERPEWFQDALANRKAQEDLLYSYMIANPDAIEYAYWDLPEPPVLLAEDRSFLSFLNKQESPDVSPEDAVIPDVEVKRINWLHKVGALLQFSQAYVSPNWYQGGNNYLSLLLGFNWNVQLNQVYHPNILFQSDFSYKLALSSNPKGSFHKYTISEDLLQYNLNAGLKAAKNWFYSFNLQFKTQLLNNYETDKDIRTASFLSPGDLNMGLGMSYNRQNKLNTFSYTLTISPLSYNLKTCISNKVDHATYNIAPDKKVKNEIGSNIEFNLSWNITSNISYKTRMFMFTDYKYYLNDWENTFQFEINKFLSTQIYVHLRYDGSTESYGKWKKFMMREILSFGLSYNFSTKP